MTSHHDSANSQSETKVAETLGRIEADMGWVKDALVSGKNTTDRQDRIISNLERVAEKLTSAVEKLTEEQKAIAKLEERVRSVENQQRIWEPAMTRWQKIHDAFVLTIVKWLVTAALVAAASSYAITRSLK